MVGGVVVGIVRSDDTLLHVGGTRYKSESGHVVDNRDDRICVRVDEGNEEIRLGDRVWWQGRRIYWTPVGRADDRVEVILGRMSYSFTP